MCSEMEGGREGKREMQGERSGGEQREGEGLYLLHTIWETTQTQKVRWNVPCVGMSVRM